MKQAGRKIGILGGTFNPVHAGHMELARQAMRRFDLSGILFIPCAQPPHKAAPDLVADKHRLAMLREAIRREPRFSVSDMELKRGGVSYSIDTLHALRRRRPRDQYFFIIGADMLAELHLWKNIYELLGLCEFVTMVRPGTETGRLRIPLKAPWPERLRANLFKGPLLDISSRNIRARVRRGWRIDHLVTAAVDRYIQRHSLYRKKEKERSKR
ncbi:MAG: Nicotinate-nucleotide adenylyltransferase [Verrucomicrobia bacterium ADurb.Bin345]|nr:MAG: Nicotinate-nucleotide adenylyltransferase [Verrucomicrobia bacterium ADurb.Bin345]